MNDAASRRAGRLALVAFAAFIVYGTTIPWKFDLSLESLTHRIDQIDWAIVHVRGGRVRRLPDVISNTLFFMPLGVAWVFASGARRLWLAAVGGLLVGAGLSVCVEALQLLTVDRTTQLGDVVFNAGGCAVAAGLTAGIRGRLPALASTAAGRWLRTPSHAVFALVASVLAIRGLAPFDVTLDVGAVKSQLKAAWADPLGLDGVGDALALGVPFVFAGVAAAGALGGARALGAMALLAFGLEAAQTFIASRGPGLGDALVASAAGALGVAFGPWLSARVRASGGAPGVPGSAAAVAAGPAVALVLVAAAAAALSPFALASADEIARHLTPRVLVPFAAYYAHLHHHVLDDLVAQALPYAFLGYVRFARSGHATRAIAAAVLSAAILEGAQIFVAGRVADAGDAVLAGLGAAAGVHALRRLRRLATIDPERAPARGPAGGA